MNYPFSYKVPLHSTAYLLNPNIDFPVAFAFGDRDFLHSQGADLIIKGNKHYETGASQLFKIPNSDHNLFFDNPDALSAAMIGFFDKTCSHVFEPKLYQEYTPAEAHANRDHRN